jgi:hypothetical protein
MTIKRTSMIVAVGIVGVIATLVVVGLVNSPKEFNPENLIVLLSTPAAYGTGIVCQRGGSTYIWTAAHVAVTAADGIITVVQPRGSGRQGTRRREVGVKARVVTCGDPHQDGVALLRVDSGRLSGDFQFAAVDAAVVDALSHCLMLRNAAHLVMWHRVTQLDRVCAGETTGGTCDVIAPSSIPGGSGGGLFNSKGQCVGLQVGTVEHSDSVGRFMPVRGIRRWAVAHNLAQAL